MKKLIQLLNLSCLFLCLAAVAFAQNAAGSLTGIVTDPNGGIVAGAKVVLKQDATGRIFNSVTTKEGLYSYPNLDVGSYTLTIEQSGFKKMTRSNIIIAISSTSVADI